MQVASRFQRIPEEPLPGFLSGSVFLSVTQGFSSLGDEFGARRGAPGRPVPGLV